ncbi:hypothetical protein FLONG3_6077 [Fusarium longipes]|uniref:Xylanolytic transcriptional activator regulatory domain-containing protein n=1 Tax=Fusarium longipes TaxID=694270 RepID=A0A395SPX8_9HYPO|nr:hypothetical protein FLONG3_6077 [Fusarium longipes]
MSASTASESSAIAAKRRLRRIPDESPPRKTRFYGSVDDLSDRYLCLEALVKGAFPDESLDSVNDLAQLGQRLGYKMPNVSDPNRKLMKVEELVQASPKDERTSSIGPEIITTDASPPGKSPNEEPQSSRVKDNSGHEHYIGPSGTLNFWNQLRNLVDSNDSQATPGRQGATKFTQDNTSRLLEADGQDQDDQPQRNTVSPEDGPSPGSMTSASARDFTRLPNTDMDEILSQFPPNQVLEQLIQSYFKNVHDDFPLFHRATFEEEYELFIVQARRDPRIPNPRPLPLPDWGWIGCLHMIAVFGSIADRTIPNIDHSALQRRSVTVARALLPQLISKCSLTNVRVLLLLALFLHNNNERNAAWNIAGTATRISFALGLHRLDMNSSFRPLEREVRKWVFCTLYSFEQFLASSLGRPSGLQELDVEVVPPREDFVEGGIGTDAKLVSWSIKLQVILSRTRLLHGVNRSPGPKLDEITNALDEWKRDIGKTQGLDVSWMKLEGRALPALDEDGAVDMEELKISLAWRSRSQLRAVLLLHIQFHYIAIVATRPLLLRDVALTRKGDAEAHKTPVPKHAALCVKHACQLSYLMILLDHFDVINGLSGLDIFYAYCSAMILILRLLRLRPGELIEGVSPDEVALQSKIRRLVATLRNVINHTDKCGSMKRLAQVVDTFSECANNPNYPPVISNLPPQGINTNNMSYPPGWSTQQMQPLEAQSQGFGSMDGLFNNLPFSGFGTIEGSVAQFIPPNEMEIAGWPVYETGITLGLLPRNHNRDSLAFIISNPEALRSAVLMAGIHFAFNAGTLSKFEPTFLYHKIETVQLADHYFSLYRAQVCRGDIVLAETHLSMIYALSNSSRSQVYAQSKTLDQELSDRYFLLTSSFVHGMKTVLKGVAHESGLSGDYTKMDAAEIMNVLHEWHINTGRLSHFLKLKSVRLFPAFFNAPYSGATLLDVDYRPMIDSLRDTTQDVHDDPCEKQQDDFWLYGSAAIFYDSIITAHTNSIYYNSQDDNSDASTPESIDESRYRTSWPALMVATQLYTEQLINIWRPFKREIFLHSLNILQRDIMFALRKPGSDLLAELIFWEAFLGLISTYGHEEQGDMDLEPGLRPFFEDIVRRQSRLLRLHTWEDVRGVLCTPGVPLAEFGRLADPPSLLGIRAVDTLVD